MYDKNKILPSDLNSNTDHDSIHDRSQCGLHRALLISVNLNIILLTCIPVGMLININNSCNLLKRPKKLN